MSELEKWDLHFESIRIITAFVDWLKTEKKVVFAEWTGVGYPWLDTLTPHNFNDKELFAEFYDIDLVQLEKERSNLLDALRSAQTESSVKFNEFIKLDRKRIYSPEESVIE